MPEPDLTDLDNLIAALQAVKVQYPNCEGSIRLEMPNGKSSDISIKAVTACEDDGEDARGHGRACGRPQVIVYIDLQEE